MKTYSLLLKKVSAFLLTVLLLFCVAVPSASAAGAKDGELYLEVFNLEQTDEGLAIDVRYDNRCDQPVTFGWVNSCNIVVETDEGIFSKPMSSLSGRIGIGNGSFRLNVYDCKGDVETVKVTELILLNNRGLPGKRVHNVVIYDHGKTGVAQRFGLGLGFGVNPGGVVKTLAVIVIGVMVLTAFIAILVVAGSRQRSGGNTVCVGDDVFLQNHMAQEAHQQAVREHQRFADQMALDAHHQAVWDHQQFADHTANFSSHSNFDCGNFMPPMGF